MKYNILAHARHHSIQGSLTQTHDAISRQHIPTPYKFSARTYYTYTLVASDYTSILSIFILPDTTTFTPSCNDLCTV